MMNSSVERSRFRADARIELQQLRFAVTAADYGSFRQAADTLGTRQSTLSRTIRQLEHLFGAAIFERSSGGVKLTSIGRSFLQTARTIVEQADALASSSRPAVHGDAGTLVIGFCTSLSAGNLRTALLELTQRYPELEIVLTERSRVRLTTALRNRGVDILILTGDADLLDHKSAPLWSERILVALPENHPFAARDVLHWTDLQHKRLLLSHHDPGRELEDLLISKLLSPHDRPRIVRHDVSRSIIKSMVSMGMGLSLVLESDIGAKFPGLMYRELRDGTGPSRIGFSAIWRPDNDNPALRNFLRFLRERYPSPGAGE